MWIAPALFALLAGGAVVGSNLPGSTDAKSGGDDNSDIASASFPATKPKPQSVPNTAASLQARIQQAVRTNPRFDSHGWMVLWNETPEVFAEFAGASKPLDDYSNIRPADYKKPAACVDCHPQQFQKWSEHPHAKMNRTASAETIVAEFDGSSIDYQGGTITAYQDGSDRLIRTEKDDVRREYRVTRTIGSRFYQYFVGVLTSGTPIPTLDETPGESTTELVLPVGWQISKRRWLPVYDVFDFMDYDDPEAVNGKPNPFDTYVNFQPKAYYERCGECHTTSPEAYRMLVDTQAGEIGREWYHVSLKEHLADGIEPMFPGISAEAPRVTERDKLPGFIQTLEQSYSADHAVTLGISCEACHFGGREHVDSEGKMPPRFLASAPHVLPVQPHKHDVGRSVGNVNQLCSRCHAAYRNLLPSGGLHKNSGEFRDATHGPCYSAMKCTHCHDPHTATGLEWPKTPAQDDQSCLACHEHYSSDDALVAHTKHPVGSSGSNCMNCHMPKVVEGLEDVVRSHRISSPNDRQVIESGGLNACNLCHLDQSIDWTVAKLGDWYGLRYDEPQIAKNYQSRTAPLSRVWLQHDDYPVRLAAIGAAKRHDAKWLAPDIAANLDTGFLINRQFAQDTLEHLLDVDLHAAGYDFWMTPAERKQTLPAIRRRLAEAVRQDNPSTASED
ncbi:multiheme c-type cytochrome [Stratiformator vulcanicus]|nr:multiheme c-type cytochrome [Stratiformator vulcanicus]